MESPHAGRPGCNDPERGRLLDGYLEGVLSRADEEAFESHYFSCKACLREMEFRQTLPAALREFPGKVSGARRFWLKPEIWGSVAAGLLVLVGGYATFLAFHRLPSSRKAADELRLERDSMQARLGELSAEVERLTREVEQARGWLGPVRLHYLGLPVRGRAGVENVQVAAGQPYVHLAVEFAPPPGTGAADIYRIMVVAGADQPVWSVEVRHADLLETLQSAEELVIAIPAARLASGDHNLQIVLQKEVQGRVLLQVPFQVERSPSLPHRGSPAATNAPQ